MYIIFVCIWFFDIFSHISIPFTLNLNAHVCTYVYFCVHIYTCIYIYCIDIFLIKYFHIVSDHSSVLRIPESENEKHIYSSNIIKYDRNGYRPRERILLATDKAIYLSDKSKLKHRIEWSNCDLILTSMSDGILFVKLKDMNHDKVCTYHYYYY